MNKNKPYNHEIYKYTSKIRNINCFFKYYNIIKNIFNYNIYI